MIKAAFTMVTGRCADAARRLEVPLVADSCLSADGIASHLGVANGTVDAWIAEQFVRKRREGNR
jgi:hypothetical protein